MFRDEALRGKPSAWAGLMNAKQYAEEAAAKDRAVDQSRAGVRNAEADLASKGGFIERRKRAHRSRRRKRPLAVGQDGGSSGEP